MRKEIKVFVLVLLAIRVVLWLTGCSYKEEAKSNVDVYETLEEMEDEFVVFYDSSACRSMKKVNLVVGIVIHPMEFDR